MKDILTSPRIKDMKRKRRAQYLRLGVLIFILLGSVIYALGYFSFTNGMTIDKVVVTGARIIDPPKIEEIIRGKISGKYIHLFSRANTFIYPKKQIYNELLTTFPRIKELKIYRDNLKTIHVDLSERSGSSLYCGKDVPKAETDVGENCYYINSDGYIFDKAPYFSGTIYFKYYIDIPDVNGNPLGAQMLPAEVYHNYVHFIDGLISLGLKPIYIVINPDGNNHLYLSHSDSGTSPEIIFKNENLDNLLENITVSMNTPSFANEINSKYNTLLYIDLRFKNKVLYKFQ